MNSHHIYSMYGLFGVYAALLLTAAIFDLARFTIPNTVVVGLVVLFPAAALILPLDPEWSSRAGAAVAVFLAGLAAYRFGALGAGDVKLLTAVSLWAGFELLPPLLLYTALSGGVLALLLVVLRSVLVAAAVWRPFGNAVAVPRVLMTGAHIPYGVAIASGAILIAGRHPYFGLYI